MANTKQARKRIRQAEKQRQHNMAMRSKMRTHLKKVTAAILAKDLTQAQESYKLAVKVVDKMVNKGIVHKNKAARHKSRLNTKIKQLGKAA